MKTCRRCYADNDVERGDCRACGCKDFVILADSATLRMQCGEETIGVEMVVHPSPPQ